MIWLFTVSFCFVSQNFTLNTEYYWKKKILTVQEWYSFLLLYMITWSIVICHWLFTAICSASNELFVVRHFVDGFIYLIFLVQFSIFTIHPICLLIILTNVYYMNNWFYISLYELNTILKVTFLSLNYIV